MKDGTGRSEDSSSPVTSNNSPARLNSISARAFAALESSSHEDENIIDCNHNNALLCGGQSTADVDSATIAIVGEPSSKSNAVPQDAKESISNSEGCTSDCDNIRDGNIKGNSIVENNSNNVKDNTTSPSAGCNQRMLAQQMTNNNIIKNTMGKPDAPLNEVNRYSNKIQQHNSKSNDIATISVTALNEVDMRSNELQQKTNITLDVLTGSNPDLNENSTISHEIQKSMNLNMLEDVSEMSRDEMQDNGPESASQMTTATSDPTIIDVVPCEAGFDEVYAIYPHAIGSTNSNILSWFMSTPFHSKAMLSFHQLKDTDKLSSSCPDCVPIMSQKNFIRSNRGKNTTEKQSNGILSEKQLAIDITMCKKSSAAIDADVSEFLLLEGKKFIESPLSSPINSPPSSPSPEADGIAGHMSKRSIGIAEHRKQSASHDTGRSCTHRGSFQQQPSTQKTQPSISQNNHTYSQNQYAQSYQRKSHYSMRPTHTHPMYNNMKNNFQQQNNPQFNHQRTNNNVCQSSHHAPAQAPAANNISFSDRPNANITGTMCPTFDKQFQNSRMQNVKYPSVPTHRRPTQNSFTATTLTRNKNISPRTSPKATVASKKMRFSKSKIDSLAKLPVVAQADKKKCIAGGTQAGKSIIGSTGRLPDPVTTVPTREGTAKSQLVSAAPAGPSFPDGWIKKEFKRITGETADRVDKYFFSPRNKIKFRSLTSACAFISILDEPEVNGNESAAWALFKSRGHRQ